VTVTVTVTGASLPAKNLSRCDRKISVVVPVRPKVSPSTTGDRKRCDRKIFVPKDNSNRSNVTVPIGDRKKITNKVHEGGGSEGTVDSRNVNKCSVLLVVHKGIEIKGVVGFKSANNQNGLACSDSNSYRMLGTVVDVGGVSVVGINRTATKNSKNIIVVAFDES